MKIYDIGIQVAIPIEKITDACNLILDYEQKRLSSDPFFGMSVISAPPIKTIWDANLVIDRFIDIIDSTNDFQNLRDTYSFEFDTDQKIIIIKATYFDFENWGDAEEEFVMKLRKFGIDGQYMGIISRPTSEFDFWNYGPTEGNKYIDAPFTIVGWIVEGVLN